MEPSAGADGEPVLKWAKETLAAVEASMEPSAGADGEPVWC